jgi:hypothetical protein
LPSRIETGEPINEYLKEFKKSIGLSTESKSNSEEIRNGLYNLPSQQDIDKDGITNNDPLLEINRDTLRKYSQINQIHFGHDGIKRYGSTGENINN